MWLHRRIVLFVLLLSAGCGAQSINGIPGQQVDPVSVNGVPAQVASSAAINGAAGAVPGLSLLTTFDNLQLAGGNPGTWSYANGTATGSGTLGSTTQTLGVTSPLGVANAMYEESANASNATTGFNSLFFRHVTCTTTTDGTCDALAAQGSVHFRYEIKFEVVSTSGMVAEEFDPDLYWYPTHTSAGYELFASLQCRLIGTDAGHWFLWNGNPSPRLWEATTFPCTATNLAPGVIHDLVLEGTYELGTTPPTSVYDSLVYDGSVVFRNLGTSYPAQSYTGSGTNNLNTENQIDLTQTPSATGKMYIDYERLDVW